jgi:hypothetical protein
MLPQGSFPPMDAAIGLDDLSMLAQDHRNGITIKRRRAPLWSMAGCITSDRRVSHRRW